MMALHELQSKLNHHIPSGSSLIPVDIEMWNSLKGGIDDFSKVLSHNIGKFGTLSPTSLHIIRVYSAMLYNAWRLFFSVVEVQDTLKVSETRQKEGTTFEQFLTNAFTMIFVISC